MSRTSLIAVLTLLLSGCGPPLVWGSDEATRNRLLGIVPFGSTIANLEAEAEERNWRVSARDDRPFAKGKAHYFGDGCEYQGGVSRYIIVAEYGLLTTSVETVWLFDGDGKMRGLCVRRTTDAP